MEEKETEGRGKRMGERRVKGRGRSHPCKSVKFFQPQKGKWKILDWAEFLPFLWQEHGLEGGLATQGWDGTPSRSPMWEKLAKAALSPSLDYVPC